MVAAVRAIVWTADGWPIVLPERYGAVPPKSVSESELVGTWQHINSVYRYQQQQASTDIILGADHKVISGWGADSVWSFDSIAFPIQQLSRM